MAAIRCFLMYTTMPGLLAYQELTATAAFNGEGSQSEARPSNPRGRGLSYVHLRSRYVWVLSFLGRGIRPGGRLRFATLSQTLLKMLHRSF
jgi:hypothetical protein